MEHEINKELRKLCRDVLYDEEHKDLPNLLQQAQILYETLLIANYLKEQDESGGNQEGPIQQTEAPKRDLTQKSQNAPGAEDANENRPVAEEPPETKKETPPEPQPAPTPPQEEPTKEEAHAEPEAREPEPEPKSEEEPRSEEQPQTTPQSREADSVVDKTTAQRTSLNTKLGINSLEIGLNDRIAFVKHLFGGSQEDFNRVLSQLNSFQNQQEAENFLFQVIKPEYNWDDKEEYEARLLGHLRRKFGDESTESED